MMRPLLAALAIVVVLPAAAAGQNRLNIFLDCEECFEDFIRSEVAFVEYVRDPAEADVHVIVTLTPTGSGGSERALAFIGSGRFAGVEHQLKATTEAGDSEDRQRRALATAITIGLLNYQAAAGIGQDLSVDVRLGQDGAARPPARDPWNNWVVSVHGSLSAQGEETNREAELSGEVGADRITNAWKITVGAQFEYSREDFDLDESETLRASRDEREFDWLVVKSLNDHSSIGALGQIESSSFDNFAAQIYAAPAIEVNVFPYSAYISRTRSLARRFDGALPPTLKLRRDLAEAPPREGGPFAWLARALARGASAVRRLVRLVQCHAGRAPGRPSSITNDARVLIGVTGRVT